jgi:hypothetical protein
MLNYEYACKRLEADFRIKELEKERKKREWMTKLETEKLFFQKIKANQDEARREHEIEIVTTELRKRINLSIFALCLQLLIFDLILGMHPIFYLVCIITWLILRLFSKGISIEIIKNIVKE